MEEKKRTSTAYQEAKKDGYSIKREINVTASVKKKDLFYFLLYHNYARFIGVIGFLFSTACLVGAIISFGKVELYSTLLLLLIGAMFTIYQPIALYRKAVKQAKHPVMQKPMDYSFGEEGMSVSQDDNCAAVSWDELWKIVARKKAIYIFTDPVRANIIPRVNNEKEITMILELARTKMPASHVKGK